MAERSPRLVSAGYYNSDGQPVISYRETLYRGFRRRRSHKKTPTSTRKSNMNRNSNDSITLKKYIFGFLFVTLPLCCGFFYLIHSLRSNLLNSGPPDSPFSPTITNTNLNAGCEAKSECLRELQDELLTLKKKVNYLLPVSQVLPNFALDSQGACILCHLSSKTYQTQEARWTFFGILIWSSSVSPRTVIQGHSPLVPGRCWPFAGGHGHLFIALSHPVAISHVTLGHIPKHLSPTGTITTAPKEFSVYGMETLDDKEIQLGTFLYDLDGDSVQTFKLPAHKEGVFNYLKLQVESNWGNPEYSCLYSFKVHGKLADHYQGAEQRVTQQ